MNVSKIELESIYSFMKKDGVCPRCGGKGHPENAFPFGSEMSLSRLADIEICPRCGSDEAMTSYANSKRIAEDFEGYADEQRGAWAIVSDMLKKMDTEEGRRAFIQSMDSDVYTGFNADGEEVIVMQQKAAGMTVKTCHATKPQWYESVEYDEDGFAVGVAYEAKEPQERKPENMFSGLSD